MPYEVFLAFRYLRSRHKRRLARVTALAAILGIALGVASLIVAFALSNGFRDEMRNKILQGTAHISVIRSDNQPLPDYRELTSRLRKVDGVITAAATTYDGAVAIGQKGSAYAVLRGVDREQGPSALPNHWMRQGSFAPLFENSMVQDSLPQVVVGAELAKRIGLNVGDSVDVLLADAGPNKQRRLRVAGIFSSGLFEYDSTWIYIPLEIVAAFVDGKHLASVVSLQVNDPDRVQTIADNVRRELGPGYTTIDWQQANQPLFAALALERRMGLFIIGLIIAVGALNITTMLILVVVERRRDVAVLRALGATSNGVTTLFVIEGAVVGAFGAAAGVALGLAICFVGNYFKLISLPADVYSISNVPLNARLSEALLSACVAFLLSILATIYPARAAAHFKPVDTLRDVG